MKRIAGKYEVIQHLGEGGMGEVYLVRHIDLEVNYALKVLNSALSSNERFIEQFKQEAALLQRFSHPGVTQLRDFGRTEDGRYYLAMDHCTGRSLKEILDSDGPYPVKTALRIVIQLLWILEAAHEQGIIHRDVKPGNIMIVDDKSANPVVKVLDFGTALLREGLDLTSGKCTSIGTPCYMSPEQASGAGSVDHRIDIYSSGILMYEVLTGEVPFEGEDIVQTLLMHVTQPPQQFAVRYGIPGYIEDVVFRALAKKTEDRYRNAAEFRRACEDSLERYENESGFRDEMMEYMSSSATNQSGDQECTSPQKKGRPTRVLCLDDDEVILSILRHLLEGHGYEVYTAVDCSAIHDYLFKDKVDLLLSDVRMPGLPGTKVCRLIKKSLSDLKVVLFSNVPERDLERLSKENGADGWISKNTRPQDWLSVIDDVMAQD